MCVCDRTERTGGLIRECVCACVIDLMMRHESKCLGTMPTALFTGQVGLSQPIDCLHIIR